MAIKLKFNRKYAWILILYNSPVLGGGFVIACARLVAGV